MHELHLIRNSNKIISVDEAYNVEVIITAMVIRLLISNFLAILKKKIKYTIIALLYSLCWTSLGLQIYTVSGKKEATSIIGITLTNLNTVL